MQLETSGLEAGMDKADSVFLEKLRRPCVESLQGLRKRNCEKQRSSSGPRGLTAAHVDTCKPVQKQVLWALMCEQPQDYGAGLGIAGSGSQADAEPRANRAMSCPCQIKTKNMRLSHTPASD